MKTHHDTLTAAYQAALLAGTSPSSRRAYGRDVAYFWAWAGQVNRTVRTPVYPVPLDLVVQFILEHAQAMPTDRESALIAAKLRKKPGPLRMSTIRRYLASLSVAHMESGVDSPTQDPKVKLLLRRLQQAQAQHRPNKKAALTADLLQRLVDTCDDSLHGIRDRAILLVGFASGGRRRSELVNMYAEDLRKVEGGYIIRLRKSKTDQAGKGHEVPILGQAATALKAWLIMSGIREGRLFRGIKPDNSLRESITGQSINLIVKRCAERAGFDPTNLGAHSLRSGFITESGRRGTALGDAMKLSGHKTTEVAQSYYRDGELLENPTGRLL